MDQEKIKPEKLIWLLDLRKVIQNEGFIMGKLLNAQDNKENKESKMDAL